MPPTMRFISFAINIASENSSLALISRTFAPLFLLAYRGKVLPAAVFFEITDLAEAIISGVER
jgi:hypothetical protein